MTASPTRAGWWSVALLVVLTWTPGAYAVDESTMDESTMDESAQPIELQPYRVRLAIAYEIDPELDEPLKRRVNRELPRICDRLLGELWQLSLEPQTWLPIVDQESLTEMQPAQLPQIWETESLDKVLLMTVSRRGRDLQLSGREWDLTSQHLGLPVIQSVSDRGDLEHRIFQLAYKIFRPMLRLNRSVDDQISYVVRAGSLATGDPHLAQLRPNQYWQPFLRYRGADGKIEKQQDIPWTVLHVSDVANPPSPFGQASIISGLRSAIPNRRSSRVELFARALEPVTASTEVKLVSRSDTTRPLVGMLVVTGSPDGKVSEQLLTDRRGRVQITSNTETPLTWLSIRSGSRTLARLPLIPGCDAARQIELPDDSLRLRIEGELQILESRLTETVARRAVVMARIRRLAQLNDWKSVTELKSQLVALTNSADFLKELNAIRVPALQAARSAGDKSTAAFIDRQCDDTSRIIQKFLDPDQLKTFEEEIEEARQTSATPQAAPRTTNQPGSDKPASGKNATSKNATGKSASGKAAPDKMPAAVPAAKPGASETAVPAQPGL